MTASLPRTLRLATALAVIPATAASVAVATTPAARVAHAPAPQRVGVIDPAGLPRFVPAPEEVTAAPRLIPNIFPSPGEIPAGSASSDLFPAPSGPGITYVFDAGDESPATLGPDAGYPAIDVRFDGPFDGSVAPPDSVVAVGKNHAVSLINLLIAMYDKAGTLKQGPFSLRTFFGIPAGFADFDPLAIYDPFSDRYIVAVLTDNGGASDSRIYVAFSQTNDPTGAWNKYFIDADRDQPNIWADYGAIGIDRNAVYLTANMFNRSGGFSNVTLFVYDKEDGYAGQALDNSHLINVRTSGNGSPFRLRPAFVGEVVPGDAYYLAHTDSSFGSAMNLFKLTGNRFASPTLAASSVPLPGTFFPVGNARQPGTGGGVSTLGTNLWNVYYRGGRLWTAMSVGGSTGIAAWVHRINVSAEPFSREQTFQVEAANSDLYFPHVIPDIEDNDFAIFSAFSSTTIYPSARYTNVGADSSVRKAELMANGARRNDSGRYGDYFAVGSDPTDPNRLWAIIQYQNFSTFAGNSMIASVRFEDVAPPSSLPPVPDGKAVPGTQVRVQRSGGNLNVTWDATTCPPPGNHLVWYDLASMASYSVKSRTCAIGTSGSWTGPGPTGNVGVIVVSDDGATTEGSHGVNSLGQERPSQVGGCGITTKNVGGTCP